MIIGSENMQETALYSCQYGCSNLGVLLRPITEKKKLNSRFLLYTDEFRESGILVWRCPRGRCCGGGWDQKKWVEPF